MIKNNGVEKEDEVREEEMIKNLVSTKVVMAQNRFKL